MPMDEKSFSPDPASHGHRIDFAARPRLLTIAFALLWLSGYLLLLTLTVVDYRRFGSVSLPGIALVAGAGPPVALALLWAACGKRESLLVMSGEVRIDRWAGPIRLSRALEVHAIRGLRVANVAEGLLSDLVAVRQFYSGGNGRIAVETDGRTFTVGHAISAEAAGTIVDRIRQLIPQISGLATAPLGRHRRIANHAATLMTVAMLGFAITVPFKLAVVDRSICFYTGAAAPRQPVDVSAMRPPGPGVLRPDRQLCR